MKRINLLARAGFALALAANLLGAAAAEEGVFVRSVRVAATDPVKAAVFYEKAFGMSEVRRIEFPTLIEIVINAGATKEAAAANPHAPIVIMTRPKDLKDLAPMANIILSVSDLDKTIAAVEAAGGTLFRKTNKLADGTTFAFVKDPEGNQVELLLAR